MQTDYNENEGSRSHLFMLRIWSENVGESVGEWRGQLLCTASGEVRYFRDWETLATLVRAMLPSTGPRSECITWHPGKG